MIKAREIIMARANKGPAFKGDRDIKQVCLPIPDPAFIGPILAPEPLPPLDSSQTQRLIQAPQPISKLLTQGANPCD